MACFGRDVVDAVSRLLSFSTGLWFLQRGNFLLTLLKYWAAVQSQNNFRVPEPGEGILLGGETVKNWLTVIVNNLSPLKYKFFCASSEVKEFIEKTAKGDVQVELINLPVDKLAIRDTFEKNDIRAVFNLCSSRAKVRYSPPEPAFAQMQEGDIRN